MKIGVLLVSYGSRAACIADSLVRSEEYEVDIYDADMQRNPFILSHSKDITVGIEVDNILKFAEKHKSKLDFGIVGPEGPIIAGVRDRIEDELGIPMICPTKEFAIEGSKVAQRELLKTCAPEANPRYKVFDPKDYTDEASVKKDLWPWLDELDNKVAVKPDEPAVGKGVGVWGDHFNTREELYSLFKANFSEGVVLVEEKIDGEEFSLQCFSDGKSLIETPSVRDYKRAFDGDLGPNTGGMGCYKDNNKLLPFMSENDWKTGLKIARRLFKKLRGDGSNPGLRGIPLYMAYTCAKDGVKLFEVNSRPGDPEIMNLLPVLKGDFVETCYDMIDGNLKRMEFENLATVITYAVPMTYGECRAQFTGSKHVDLTPSYNTANKYNDKLRIYPGSMELRDDGKTYMCDSRAVGYVGIGESLEEARKISLEGITSLDGALWNRWDIGSKHHVQMSIDHMADIRRTE
jgi:phosphoribosylamine--glycine ligase|tara:strand:+ start:9329 stop:10711 length:1383 start_codon:yes stop_codon:yes gene_type:complete